MEPALINKEEIMDKVRFPQQDVLLHPEQIKERQKSLEKAMLLGNGYKGKIKIVFNTDQGDKLVETTVWATTEKNIQLKGGVSIPIHAIREVII